MKIKTITYTERKVLAQYEYAELTSTAELAEGEDEVDAVIKLMAYVTASLNKEISKTVEAPVVETPVVVEEPKKEKKPKAKKEKVVEEVKVEEAPAETPEEYAKKSPPKNVVIYNSNLAEHKSIFGGYLTKKYENSWKTSHPADEIKSFTASLNGKHFLDNDGKIVESFLNLVHEFFGA